MNGFDHSTQLQRLLDRLRAGDDSVRDALVGRAFERLRVLAGRMFRRHADLRPLIETDDVLQGAAFRLHRSLPEVHPAAVRQFFRLAATHVRRELTDLARHHLHVRGAGPLPIIRLGGSTSGGHHGFLNEAEAAACEPEGLEEWTAFHEAVGRLPEEEGEIFDLLWYQDLSQAEAAALLGVSERTVKRRWRSARFLLAQALRGDWSAQ